MKKETKNNVSPFYAESSFSFTDAVVGFRRMAKYVSEDRGEFIFLCFLALVTAFLDPVATYFFSRIIFAITDPYLVFGISATFIFLGLWALAALTHLFIDRISRVRGKLLDEKARVKFYTRVNDGVLRLPLSFHKNTNSGALWDKVNTAGVAIADLFSNAVIPLAPQIISIMVMLVISFFVNWVFGAIFLVGVLAYLYSIYYWAIPQALLQRQVQKTFSAARAHAVDALANVRAVKDFTAEEREHEKSIELFEGKAYGIWGQFMAGSAKYHGINRLIVFVTRAVTLLLSLMLIGKNMMTVADLVLLNMYVGSIFNPLLLLSQQWITIQKSVIALDEAEEIIGQEPEVYVPSKSKNIPHIVDGAVEFNHVSFSYHGGQKILNDVSFEVKAGEVVALVGESGVGKSTTMDLISAYHFATKGKVLMNKIDMRNIPLKELRSQIAVVPQETVLFNDTIRTNLLYGNFQASDKELFAAAKKAHCYDFIQKFSQGWDTVVGERGFKLSVGQKQRISIARAILRNPKILILDEPTSALDAGTEKIITESFEELMKGRTTFIIAHRLSTVRRADLILVFKDGKIIERGTHSALLEIADGEYKRLHDLQIGLHA